MKQAQYERILQKLEKAAKLMQDPKRASAAGRLLVYPNIEELQSDVNELLNAFRANEMFMLDSEELFEGIEELSFADVNELDLLDVDAAALLIETGE